MVDAAAGKLRLLVLARCEVSLKLSSGSSFVGAHCPTLHSFVFQEWFGSLLFCAVAHWRS